MTGFEPIIYIISGFAAETIKDLSKHIGKKAKESLHESIIQLSINDYYNSREIQQKLEAKPELKAEIDRKIDDNWQRIDKGLPILIKRFNKDSKTNKNNTNIDISGVKESTIITNVNPNNAMAFVIIIAIFAVFAIIVIYLLTNNQRAEQPANQNPNINLLNRTQTNVISPNINQNTAAQNEIQSSINKVAVKPTATAKIKKADKNSVSKSTEPPPCALTPKGC